MKDGTFLKQKGLSGKKAGERLGVGVREKVLGLMLPLSSKGRSLWVRELCRAAVAWVLFHAVLLANARYRCLQVMQTVCKQQTIYLFEIHLWLLENLNFLVCLEWIFRS